MNARAITGLCILSLACQGCLATGEESAKTDPKPKAKITFDLKKLNDKGLYGPPSGLRTLSYEFCIPGNKACAEEVKRIDPSVRIHKGSRGRIGCTKDQYLCIGETGQKNFREVLKKLAELDYVKRIDQCFFE